MPGRIGLSLSRGQLPPSPPCAARATGVRGSEPWEPAKLVQAILSGLEGGAGFRGRMRPNRPARMAYTAISRGRSTLAPPETWPPNASRILLAGAVDAHWKPQAVAPRTTAPMSRKDELMSAALTIGGSLVVAAMLVVGEDATGSPPKNRNWPKSLK